MNSIQRKLGISLALGITLLWLLASFITGKIVSHELGEASDSALKATAGQLLAIVPAASTGPAFSAIPSYAPDESMEHSKAVDSDLLVTDTVRPQTDHKKENDAQSLPAKGSDEHKEFQEISSLLSYVIRDPQGLVINSGGDPPPFLSIVEPIIGFGSMDGYRLYSEQSADRERTITIAEPLHHREEFIVEAILILASTLPLLIPLSLGLVWWIVRRSMRDVQEVQVQIESRGGNDLKPLSTGGMPRELVPIAESVNRLLGRLSRTLEAERHFTTNSAHELRTPIASALAQTQRQIASLSSGPEQERARRIEQTLQDLARTSEKLMQLARAESGSLVSDTWNNAFPVLEYLVEEYRSMHRNESRLQVSCTDARRFMTPLDADGAAILLRNLIDNALKYGDPGSPVEIVVDSDQNELRVINDGPVIPVAEMAFLKERFRRGAPQRVSGEIEQRDVISPRSTGSGLGLAIAETIASHAGVSLSLRSPATGRDRGFEAVLSAVQPS